MILNNLSGHLLGKIDTLIAEKENKIRNLVIFSLQQTLIL